MTIQEEQGTGEAMFLQAQERLGSIAQLALDRSKNNSSG